MLKKSVDSLQPTRKIQCISLIVEKDCKVLRTYQKHINGNTNNRNKQKHKNLMPYLPQSYLFEKLILSNLNITIREFQ